MYVWPEEIPSEEYIRLYFLEKTLRQLVVDQLSMISERWWKQRIPGDVRKKAEDRKKDEEEKLVHTVDLHPIWYVDFLDYVNIVTRKDNWRDVFKKIFRNKDHFRGTMEKLSPIRNKIAHMRPLSVREKINLDALSQDILVPIWVRVYNEQIVKPSERLAKQGKIREAEDVLIKGFEKTRDPWIAYKVGKLFLENEKFNEAKKFLEYAQKYLVLPKYKELAKKKLLEVEKKIEFTKFKVCPKCGSKISKEHSYCGECGYKFQ